MPIELIRPIPENLNLRERKMPPWTTEAEIAWIDRIGEEYQRNHPHIPMDRTQLLKNYLKASTRRVRWGDIDQARCIAHVCRLLTEIQLEARK